MKTWFGQAQSFVDQASRMYAASFHAPDAPREGRIDAIAEAAELDMTMARSLDEAGLGSLPVAWRADPAVASTFEDIAVGPTRRWRDEARVLARQCIDTARDSGVLTEAARRCAALRTGTPLKAQARPRRRTRAARALPATRSAARRSAAGAEPRALAWLEVAAQRGDDLDEDEHDHDDLEELRARDLDLALEQLVGARDEAPASPRRSRATRGRGSGGSRRGRRARDRSRRPT